MGRFLVIATVAAALGLTALLAVGASAAVNCGGGVTVKGGTACWKAKSTMCLPTKLFATSISENRSPHNAGR